MGNLKTNEENICVFNITEGKLINGAKKLINYNFVSDIGGKNNGTSEVSIKVINSCVYYLYIKYVAYEENLSFKIELNGIDNNKIYYTDFSPQWSITNTLTFTLPLLLNSGNNIIKFYGNELNKAPYLGYCIVNLPPITNDLTKGIIENGAFVYNNNFVSAIGGPTDGSVTITTKVNEKGIYNLIVGYVAVNKKGFFNLDINGKESEISYNIPLTDSLDISSLQTFTIPIFLNFGHNTIKFHGDGINYGPNLNSIFIKSISNTVTSIFSASNVYNVSDGVLGGGAIIDKVNKVVTKIGGINDGYSTIRVNIDILGDYLIKLNYINNNRPLRIDINGIQNETIYNVKGSNKDIFSTTISLVSGINTLKFHGDDLNFAPDLGTFTLELVKDKSDIFSLNGLCLNGANFLKNGGITKVGGSYEDEKGYKLKYFADYWGYYEIYVSLFALKDIVLYVNFNDENSKDYLVKKSEVVTVERVINFLKQGENIITFFGGEDSFDILNIDIKLLLTMKESIYNLTEGILEKGAILDDSKKFVEELGGINNGAVTIKVNINNPLLYDLNINYIGEAIRSPLKIEVTGDKNFNSNTICILPPKESSNELKLQNFKTSVQLTSGINNIKFSGNEIDSVPKLSYIELSEALENQVSLINGSKLFSKLFYGKDAFLNNDAKLVSNFIKGVGGIKNGEAIFEVKLPKETEYTLEIKYLKINDNDKVLISFNGINNGTVYNPPKTNSLNEKDAKIFTINIFLGEINELVFYGDGTNNSPLIGNINITEIKLPEKKSYKISDIKLINIYKNYSNGKFITLIGNHFKEKIVKLIINIETIGWYDIGFKYLCSVNTGILEVKANIDKVQEINLAPTKDFQIINAQTYTIPIFLANKTNEVSFRTRILNDVAPIIGDFNININYSIFMESYDTKKAVLINYARINNYGFITNIGGPKQGKASFNLFVQKAGVYELNIEYIAIEDLSFLEIDVNGKLYTINFTSKTKEWSLVDIPKAKIKVNLDKNNNLIIFKQEKLKKYAPFLGKITIASDNRQYLNSRYLDKGSFDITKGILENGANVFGYFVTDIGGFLGGIVTITVDIEESSLYSMNIEYRALEISFLIFDVNGEKDGKIYVFTNLSDCDYTKIKEVNIVLNKGKNLIKFYGIKNRKSPDLSTVSLIKI